MTLHRTTVTKRLFALLASTSLIMTMGACSSANETQSHETDSPSTATATDAGNVVIFTLRTHHHLPADASEQMGEAGAGNRFIIERQ